MINIQEEVKNLNAQREAMQYETKPYCEFKMMDAVKEYDKVERATALMVATKHGVPVHDLHHEYAKYKAKEAQYANI